MIRKFKNEDLGKIMELWLASNIGAHKFIPKSYWQENFDFVKEILPKSEVYIYENLDEIVAFVGIDSGYIAGIFVDDKMRSQGIGKILLDKIKELYVNLSLSVYEKNEKAVSFYKREGFVIDKVSTDENTGETEYFMIWNR